MSAEELPLIETPEDDARPSGLTLASISRDGRRMLFVDAAGREFTAEVDDRLRAALPAQQPRRQETPVTTPSPANPLRPKDIQTRIRAGESAEDVAASAGTTAEKIMPFAGPVLAEREHMAERAQKASVRRGTARGAEATSARTLGQAVAARLRSFYLEPDVVDWDAYRRPDGRWAVLGTYTTPDREGIAEVAFDTAGNYVSLENDDARWLVGELLEAPVPEPVADDLLAARLRREQVVPEQTPPDQAAATQAAPVQEPAPEPVAEEGLFEPTYALEEPTAEPESEAPRPPATKPSRRKRASVPSWDEIMFGGGRAD